jgi:hypothetical protein
MLTKIIGPPFLTTISGCPWSSAYVQIPYLLGNQTLADRLGTEADGLQKRSQVRALLFPQRKVLVRAYRPPAALRCQRVVESHFPAEL